MVKIKRETYTLEMQDVKTETRLDLHEKRVHEVEELLSKFIDRAIINDLERLVVIHGKGSGKVQREVWRYLESNPAVSSYEFAGTREGSYGATVVILK